VCVAVCVAVIVAVRVAVWRKTDTKCVLRLTVLLTPWQLIMVDLSLVYQLDTAAMLQLVSYDIIMYLAGFVGAYSVSCVCVCVCV